MLRNNLVPEYLYIPARRQGETMNNRNIWLSTLSDGDADAVQLDLFFDSQDVVVEDAEDLQDVE